MVEQQLHDAISSASVISLCGSRIYPLVLPTTVELPAIHYAFIAGNSKTTQDTFGSQRYLVEVNCWGERYKDAVDLRYAVVTALSQYNQGGTMIQYMQSTDFYDEELLTYRAMAEFYIFHNFVPLT